MLLNEVTTLDKEESRGGPMFPPGEEFVGSGGRWRELEGAWCDKKRRGSRLRVSGGTREELGCICAGKRWQKDIDG